MRSGLDTLCRKDPDRGKTTATDSLANARDAETEPAFVAACTHMQQHVITTGLENAKNDLAPAR